MEEMLSQTFWDWQYDDMEEVCTLTISKKEMLEKAQEFYDYQSFEEIEDWMKDIIWDILFEEWEEEQSEKDVEYWEADD